MKQILQALIVLWFSPAGSELLLCLFCCTYLPTAWLMHTLLAAACPILLSTFKAFLAPQLGDTEQHVLFAVGDAAGDWRKRGRTW